MTSKTYMGLFSDDKKHELERKFGYKYRALESIYPNADKLPDNEIQKAIDVFYDGSPNESTDVMVNRVKDYTTKNEPIWNEKYFNPKPKLTQEQTPNLMQKPKKQTTNKRVANQIWDKHASKLPGYESGYLLGMIKSVVDHLGDMDNKNISEIGKQAYNIYQDYKEFKPLD